LRRRLSSRPPCGSDRDCEHHHRNQVVSRANIEQLAELKAQYPDAAIYSLVDSESGLSLNWPSSEKPAGRAQVPGSAEVGYAGGRTGVRTPDAAKQ